MEKLSDYNKSLCSLVQKTIVTNQYKKEVLLDQGARLAVEITMAAKQYSNKIMIIGNGGSAAIAGHLQNDLAKAVAVRAMAFTDISLMTALSNDDGYDTVYETPIMQWAEDGDVLIAISSSGNSENIIKGVKAAINCGCKVVTFSGFKKNNALRKLGDLNFYVPKCDYGYVESVHAILSHYVTDQAQAISQEKANDILGEKTRLRVVKENYEIKRVHNF